MNYMELKGSFYRLNRSKLTSSSKHIIVMGLYSELFAKGWVRSLGEKKLFRVIFYRSIFGCFEEILWI